MGLKELDRQFFILRHGNVTRLMFILILQQIYVRMAAAIIFIRTVHPRRALTVHINA